VATAGVVPAPGAAAAVAAAMAWFHEASRAITFGSAGLAITAASSSAGMGGAEASGTGTVPAAATAGSPLCTFAASLAAFAASLASLAASFSACFAACAAALASAASCLARMACSFLSAYSASFACSLSEAATTSFKPSILIAGRFKPKVGFRPLPPLPPTPPTPAPPAPAPPPRGVTTAVGVGCAEEARPGRMAAAGLIGVGRPIGRTVAVNIEEELPGAAEEAAAGREARA